MLCFFLSIAYSWRSGPFRRLKEIGGADNVTNALGSGPIALAIGWSARAPLDDRFAPYAIGFFLALFGGFTTTQIFQLHPTDTYATARNYTALVGAPRALRIGALAFVIHVFVLVFAVGSVAHAHGASAFAFASWAVLVVFAAAHSLSLVARSVRESARAHASTNGAHDGVASLLRGRRDRELDQSHVSVPNASNT